VMVRAFIPMDDEHCMFVGLESQRYNRPQDDRFRVSGEAYRRDNVSDNATGWYDRYRMIECEENDYLIDRIDQREKSFTGIEGIHTQDQCVTESMGAMIDHSFENLAPSDIAIARNRRMLLNAAKALQEGKRPPAADNPELYAHVRGGYYTTTQPGDWLTLHTEAVAALLAREREPAPAA
jgi:phthalate 4,5-dioxygenase